MDGQPLLVVAPFDWGSEEPQLGNPQMPLAKRSLHSFDSCIKMHPFFYSSTSPFALTCSSNSNYWIFLDSQKYRKTRLERYRRTQNWLILLQYPHDTKLTEKCNSFISTSRHQPLEMLSKTIISEFYMNPSFD